MNPNDETSGLHSIRYYTGPERRALSRVEASGDWVTTLLRRLWALIAYSDTTPTRFTLAIAASMWAGMLLFPGNSFDRPVYHVLVEGLGEFADEKIGIAWAILSVALWWRLLSSVPRPRIALAINIASAMLFSAVPVGVILDHYFPLPAGQAPAFALAFASYWVAVRTNVYSNKGWRGD